MDADKSKSLLMAQRLKELRTEKGLSYESLRKALMDKYEIDISIDSLKNYEVSKVPHAKAYKNEGMRVEYLRCLADFYGVSADYLLGLSDITTPNIEKRAICDKTGLSSLAVHNLMLLHEFDMDRIIKTIDVLLQNEDICCFLDRQSEKVAGENVFRTLAELFYSPIAQGSFLLADDGSLKEGADSYTNKDGVSFLPPGYIARVPANDLIEKTRFDRIVASLKRIRAMVNEEEFADGNY